MSGDHPHNLGEIQCLTLHFYQAINPKLEVIVGHVPFNAVGHKKVFPAIIIQIGK